MNRIVMILIERDEMTEKDAEEMVEDAKERVAEGEDPEDILMEEFGLEPDYVLDLIW